MRTVVKFRRGSLIRVPVVRRHRTECTRNMVLDTGARFTVLDTNLVERIGLETRAAPDIRLVGVTGSASVRTGVVDEVSLLGQTVRRLKVICHPLEQQLGFHGIVGMNFLQHFNFEVRNETEVFTASKWHE